MNMANVSSRTPLTDPVLVSPQREAPVTGREVELRWEPVRGARAYLVQIATDTDFRQVVLEESAGAETSLRLQDAFPEDRTTFYWRVFAQGEGGESPGEHVESFIAMTPDEVQAAPVVEPDTEESLGPGAALVKAAGAEAAAEATGSDKAAVQANAMGVEPEGVESAQILGITLSVIVALAIIIVLLFNWKATVSEATAVQAVGESGYPELREVESSAARELDHYEVLNDANGVYRVPIDRVITILSNEARTSSDTAYSSELPFFNPR